MSNNSDLIHLQSLIDNIRADIKIAEDFAENHGLNFSVGGHSSSGQIRYESTWTPSWASSY